MKHIEKSINSINTSKTYNKPYKYWVFKDFLEQDVLDKILELDAPIGGNGYNNTRNVDNDETQRTYLKESTIKKYPVFKTIEDIFTNDSFKKSLETKLGIDLKKYPYLRSEFVQDISPFCLTPHTDETIKACTILIYLSKDMDSESMGTELYENEDMSGLTVKAPFISNTGYIFLPDGKTTWHGIKEVKFEGVRKVLIINYVGPGWRDTHQLYNL